MKLKHKHDWQLTGTVDLPTGKYLWKKVDMGGTETGLNELKIPSFIHICRSCEKIKTTRMSDLVKKD